MPSATMPWFKHRMSFVSETLGIGATAKGAYYSLLEAAWNSPGCRLPNNRTKLARWAQCTPKQWRTVERTVLGLFERDDEGFLLNPQLMVDFRWPGK